MIALSALIIVIWPIHCRSYLLHIQFDLCVLCFWPCLYRIYILNLILRIAQVLCVDLLLAASISCQVIIPERWNAVAVLHRIITRQRCRGRTNLKSIDIIGFPFELSKYHVAYVKCESDVCVFERLARLCLPGSLWLVGVRPNLYGTLETVRLNLNFGFLVSS